MLSARRIRFDKEEFPLRSSKNWATSGASSGAGRAKAPVATIADRVTKKEEIPIFAMRLRSVKIRIEVDDGSELQADSPCIISMLEISQAEANDGRSI